ncbi:MAG: hypothetical protein A2Y02_01470 [Omnitrophica bacterium GWA2_52_12]|nr:MAG: hypothetical protein A2Y02_01470 [Omnitrophica bacterium GWA2_52_12]
MVKIPFLNTEPETDIAAVAALTPLWWGLGFSFFIYHGVVLLLFMKLVFRSRNNRAALRVPKICYAYGAFLVIYAVSLLVNAGERPAQRLFASANNWGMFLMGAMLLLVVYNSDPAKLVPKTMNACRWLCLISGLLACVSLLLWLAGFHELFVQPVLMRLMPSLSEYPFFNSLMIMKITMTEWLWVQAPRLSLYSGAPTATGGLMVMIMPLMLAFFYWRRGRFFEGLSVQLLSYFALFFAQSRSAVCGWFAALFFVEMMTRRRKFIAVFTGALALTASANWLYDGILWLLNLRPASNVGRFKLYDEAIEIVRDENLLLGLGIRLRDDFTMTPIGSHAFYIELLFVTGLLGLMAYILFQLLIGWYWLRQCKFLRSEEDRQLWKYLGLGFWATNLWLMTDSIVAFPHITYLYFLLTGLLLVVGKAIEQGVPVLPSLQQTLAEKEAAG